MTALIELIKKIEKCPPLYLIEPSLTNLSHLVEGYFWGFNDAYTDKRTPSNPFAGFNEYISDIYDTTLSLNYCGIILLFSENEEDALKKFFKHFDDYIRIPDYKKNPLYLKFKSYAEKDNLKLEDLKTALDTYLTDYPQRFSNNKSDIEVYTFFKKYLSDKQGLKDADNWDSEYLAAYKDERIVLKQIFCDFTEFIKDFVGEQHY